MAQNKINKLELTWIGKDEEPLAVEPRLLIETPKHSFGEVETGTLPNGKPWKGNMLIHGDNLLALKALEQDFAGQVKCIFIDPPYNIDAANEHYDDFVEHSKWLSLIKPRLEILRNLLDDRGAIFIQIGDEEQAYLKVLCDEVFGRSNFLNMISVNMKSGAGASGGGEDKRLKKNCEFILVYAKKYAELVPFIPIYDYREMYNVVESYRKLKISWHYNSVLVDEGEREYVTSTYDGEGNEIKIFSRKNAIIKSIRQVMADENITEKETYYKYANRIFEAKDAQSSIRTRVKDAKKEKGILDDVVSIEYIPRSGKNKGKVYEQFYKGDSCRLFAWLGDIGEFIDGILYKKERQGTYWNMTSYLNNLTKEGTVLFPNGKKPEALINRIFEMCTASGDLVLDSFLGSGTTAAVAHKMGRRWIGVELGDHAYTHCAVRMRKVIEGEQGGISKSQNWRGGGGFKFYELAPSLLNHDKYGNLVINKEYNADMLAEAMCKVLGYHYKPDTEKYWKQGYSSEKSFIYTTTMAMQETSLEKIASEIGDNNLLICCSAFIGNSSVYPNITVKKIPSAILKKCEWGREGYPLNLKDYHPSEAEFEFEEGE